MKKEKKQVLPRALGAMALALAAVTLAAYCLTGRPAETDIRAMPPSLHDGQALALDLNTATAEQLDELPGIGPALAERIMEARPLAGPEDLMDVSGIGPATYEAIAPYITFSHGDGP